MKIVGILSKNFLHASARSILQQGVRRLKQWSLWRHQYFQLSKNAYIGLCGFGHEPYAKPYFDNATKKFVIIDGYIFNPFFIDYRITIDAAIKVKPFLSEAEFMSGYAKGKDQFLKILNGSFTILIYDSQNNNLEIISDRYGSRPIFYSKIRNDFYFASELKVFPRSIFKFERLNWKSISSILSYQQIFGNETLLDGVSLAPPSSVLKYNAGKVLIRKYYARSTTQGKKYSDQFIMEHAKALYKNAIMKVAFAASTLQKNLLIPLSGGYDSRLIVAILKRFRLIPFSTISTDKDIPLSVDSSIASKLAGKLKISNRVVSLPTELYSKYWLAKIYLLDGMIGEEHLWMMPMVDSIKRPRVVLDGFRGDMLARLSERKNLRFRSQTSLQSLAEKLLPSKSPSKLIAPAADFYVRVGFDLNYCSQFLKRSAFSKLQKYSKTQIIRTLRGVDLSSPSLYTICLEELLRRNVINLPNNILGRRAFVLYPYLENQLYEFLISIPNHRKIKMKFTQRILYNLIPNSMSIPSTNDQDIKEKYKNCKREVAFNNIETARFFRKVTASVNLPSFVGMSKNNFMQAMDRFIEERTVHQDLGLLQLLAGLDIFFPRTEPLLKNYDNNKTDPNS